MNKFLKGELLRYLCNKDSLIYANIFFCGDFFREVQKITYVFEGLKYFLRFMRFYLMYEIFSSDL